MIEGLVEVAYSKLPEHAALKAEVAAVNRQSQELARQFGQALPEALQDFWNAYAGWFGMYSVGPLLAHWHVARQALDAGRIERALVCENWHAGAWWSGRYQVWPALVDELRRRGVPCRTSPGGLLRALQPLVASWGGRRQMLREAHEEAHEWLLGRSLGQHRQAVAQGAALWLSIGGSSVDLMARLIPVLRDGHGIASEIVDFHYYSSAAACQRHSLPYRDITTFMDDRAEGVLRGALRQVPRWWRHCRAHIGDLPCRRELPPALFAALCDRLRLVLQRDAPLWLVRAYASQHALDAYQPAVLVSFHVYGPPAMPLVVEAQKRGLPVVCLQHGVIGPRYLALPCSPFAEKLVFGSYARDIIREICPPELPVTITGHCLYDDALTPGSVSLSPAVQRLREGVRGLVVLCTQFNEAMFYDPRRWWLAEVARVCREQDVRLAIKVHPSDPPENIARYRGLEQPDDDRVVVVPHGQHPLTELLAACDVMVTRDSTVVFEANLLDKPVVTINLGEQEEELPYAATGGALGVYEFPDIAPALTRALFDPPTRARLAATRPAFLEAHTGPPDGAATARVSAIIAAWARGTRQP